MQFSYNELKKFIALPKPQRLADCLTTHAFQVESAITQGDDWVFDVDVMPNREDAKTYEGMAREIAAITNSTFKIKNAKLRYGKSILLDPAYVNNLLGTDIKPSQMREFLERLFFRVEMQKEIMMVSPPAWRKDIALPEDCIEEIGRLWGYGRIVAESPRAELGFEEFSSFHFFEEKVRDLLKGVGGMELNNYIFSATGSVALRNPARKDLAFLKSSLLEDVLRAIAANNRAIFFEIGTIFCRKEKEKEVKEQKHLIVGKKGSLSDEVFYEMKGVVWTFLEELGFTDMWVDEVGVLGDKPDDASWPLASRATWRHPQRAALIKIGDETVGSMFEVHPVQRERLSLREPAAVAEILLPRLFDLFSAEKEYRPISRYPAIERDIAVLVPLSERMDRVQEAIETAGGDFLSDSDLLDFYEGSESELREGTKSMTFRLVFQSHDRTLRDEEINAAMDDIKKAIEARDWEIR